MRLLPALAAALLLSGCAAAPAQPTAGDPLERINRSTFAFNDAVDRAVLRPVARGYEKAVPKVLRTGVDNFTTHLRYPLVLAHNILQLKPKAVLQDVTRLVVNTTLGIGGLLDPASQAFGLPRYDEDLGQTLGYWGVPSGPYLVLPFLGPSTLRDAVSTAGEIAVDPTDLIDDDAARYTLLGLRILTIRVSLLPTDELIDKAYDPYAFVRNAWLQRRAYLVRDGEDSGEPLEEPLEDPETEPEGAAPPPADAAPGPPDAAPEPVPPPAA